MNVSTADAFASVIEQAVENAVRKALNINEATNRRLMSVEEASTYLSVSKREIANMISNRCFPAVRRGRRTMIDIRDLDKWIEETKR